MLLNLYEGKVMSSNEVQFRNTLFPIFPIPFDKSMDFKELQFINASLSILFSDPLIVTVSRFVHPLKVPNSIHLTFRGMVMEVRLVQPAKAPPAHMPRILVEMKKVAYRLYHVLKKIPSTLREPKGTFIYK